jgi:general secretion pathway protein H
MRTSVITNNKPGRFSGFSLLEIMVVAALIALVAAVAVPTLMRDPGGGLDEQGDRVSGLLQQLSEQSLFLGELLAVRLESDAVRPLRFAHEEGEFVAMDGAGELGALELSGDIRLEWRLEDSEDRQGVNLREAVSSRMMDDEDESGGEENGEEDKAPPQVFFFPSGEATPITLWLRREGADGEGMQLKLNSLGRVERPSRENGGNEG